MDIVSLMLEKAWGNERWVLFAYLPYCYNSRLRVKSEKEPYIGFIQENPTEF